MNILHLMVQLQEDSRIYIYGMVPFHCISISRLVGRRVCIKLTVPQLYIQPSPWRWTVGFETNRRHKIKNQNINLRNVNFVALYCINVAGSIPAGVTGISHWNKIFPIALWPWGRLSLHQKWVLGEFPGGKVGRCIKLKTYHQPLPLLWNLATLRVTSWKHLDHSRSLTGLIYL